MVDEALTEADNDAKENRKELSSMPPLPLKNSFEGSDLRPVSSTPGFAATGGKFDLPATDSCQSDKSSHCSDAQAVREAILDPSDWVLKNRRTGQEVNATAFAEALMALRPSPQLSMTSPHYGTSIGKGWARGHRKKSLAIQRPTLLPQGGSDFTATPAAPVNPPLSPPSLKLSLSNVPSMTPARSRGRASFAGSSFSRGFTDSSLHQSNSDSTASNTVLSASACTRAIKLSDMSVTQVIPTLHPGGILAMSFSPSGEFLATCGADQRCCVFRVQPRRQVAEEEGLRKGFETQPNALSIAGHLIDDQPMRILLGHVGSIVAVTWAGDDSVLLTASEDGTVRCWHPLEGDESSAVYEHGGGVTSVAWDPAVSHTGGEARTGRFLTGCMDSRIRLFSLGSSEPEQSVLSEKPVTAIAFCQRGQRFAAGFMSGTVGFYRTEGMTREATVECRRHGFRHTAAQRKRLATSPVERLSVVNDSFGDSLTGRGSRRRRSTMGMNPGNRVSGIDEERVTGLCFRPEVAPGLAVKSESFSICDQARPAPKGTPPSTMDKMVEASPETASPLSRVGSKVTAQQADVEGAMSPTTSAKVGGASPQKAPPSSVGDKVTAQQVVEKETDGGGKAWTGSMADLLVSTNDNRSRILVSVEGGGGVTVGFKLKGHCTEGLLGRHTAAKYSEDGNLIVSGSTDGHMHVFTTPSALGMTTPRRTVAWSSGREAHQSVKVCEKTVAVRVALFAPARVVRGGTSNRVILTGDDEGNCKIFCERDV